MRSHVRVVWGMSSLLVAGSLALAAPAWGEAVNQSRLRITLQETDTYHLNADDLADFCRDDDGCTITILVYDLNETYFGSVRFVLNTFPPGWASTVIQNEIDGGGLTVLIVQAQGGAHGCFFTDGDLGSDSALGFKLGFSTDNENPATCVMTVID